MDPNGAIRQNVPKAILVAVVNPLDNIRREVRRVKDFLNTTTMHVGKTSLQLLGDKVEEF